MFLETGCAVFFVGGINRLSNAVTVKHQARVLGKIHFHFREAAKSESERHAAFVVERTRSEIVHQNGPQVSGVGKGESAAHWIKHRVNHGDKLSGREILNQQSI